MSYEQFCLIYIQLQYKNYTVQFLRFFFFNLWNFDILPNDLNVICILTHTITLWVLINSKGIAHILKEFAFCYCKISNPCPPRAKQSITQRVVPYIYQLYPFSRHYHRTISIFLSDFFSTFQVKMEWQIHYLKGGTYTPEAATNTHYVILDYYS